MKKQVLVALALSVSLYTLAQKKEVKAFEKAGFLRTKQMTVEGVCVERLDRLRNDTQDPSCTSI